MKYKFHITMLLSCVLAALFNYIPFSVIVGSVFSFFSFSNGVLPLLGFFGGSLGAFIGVSLKFMLYPSHALSTILVHKVPGFCASLYWSLNRFITGLIIPIIMILLFLVHPVGRYAFLYPMLWMIPIVLYLIRSNSFFCQALSATFLAHAVGSVAWLYLFSTLEPMMWHALIPVALTERLSFALLMTFIRSVVVFVVCRLRNWRMVRSFTMSTHSF
ncbi:hypothetical protein IPH25_01725 [bacterium]|nr:MAG: hypothetical protein IPG37_03855 [bacterium]QQR62145.1 MAG: hypothetical protein IPH25_01725 [bacterium]QQR63298.1 MAG: hypothetical protein IPH67_02385 [bacterium]